MMNTAHKLMDMLSQPDFGVAAFADSYLAKSHAMCLLVPKRTTRSDSAMLPTSLSTTGQG